MTGSSSPHSRPDAKHSVRTWHIRGFLRGRAATNGAAIATAVLIVGLWLWRSSQQLLAGAPWVSWRIQLADIALAIGAGLLAAVLVCVLGRLGHREPALWLPWAVVSAGILAYTMGGGASQTGWLIVAVLLLVGAGLLGGSAIGALGRRRSSLVAGGVGMLLIVLVAAFLVWPGPGADPAPVPAATGPAVAKETADPGAGTLAVTELRYGSGRPGIEPAYGGGVDLVSEPVDASGLLQGWGPGAGRSSVWGFDAAALPINGRLFVPAGSGPFPLVVVVHGNSLFSASEDGFGYLARAVAAQGYVVATIDENFLSTGLLDRSDPIGGAGITRAWLVLQHVHRLLGWSAMDGGPLSGRIDSARVALVGHSRGGEAVAVAAALARGRTVPGLPVAIPSSGTITAVVALAPSDGQTLLDGMPVMLTGIDYLTLGGSSDADVGTFAGAQQYARVTPGRGRVKAAVLMDRANHTQFNQSWGRHDLGQGAAADLLATGSLMPAEDQRRATVGLVGSFLDLTMQRKTEYRSVFDGSQALPTWLPATTYLREFSSGDGSGLQTWSEGEAGPHPLGTSAVQGATASVAPVPTRMGPSTDLALRLDVTAAEASWTLSGLRPDAVNSSSTITVSAAGTAPDAAVGIRLRMVLKSGASVDITPTPFASLPGVLPSTTLKPLVPGGSGNEPTFVTYAVSPEALVAAGVAGDQISGFSVVLTGAAGTSVYLDDVGVR